MSEREVRFLWELCCKIRASAPPEFWTRPMEELCRAWNGIGPEDWPEWVRKFVSYLLRPFAAAALIHDWEFSRECKSYGMFTDANIRLAVNVAKFAVYDRRLILIPYGAVAGILCQFFGYKAYKNGKLREAKP